ncbi:MAG: transporter substrate-binding domain-containing protein [Rhodomicrobium sp.]
MSWFARSYLSLISCFLLLLMAPARADTLADIRAKGEIVVGTKADYPPYGFKNETSQIVGIEPDLAADLAKRIGVKLRIVPVLSSNRMQLLQEGKIDLMIATLSITEERRQIVGIIDPAYYAAGIAGLADPKAGIESETDLKGKSVCAIKGNFFNDDLRTLYMQKDPLIFDSVPAAEEALTQGRCVIFVFDETLMLSKKKYEAEKWKNYALVQFTEVDPLPWGIAVKLEDRKSAYGKLISAAIVDWHRTGLLVDLEKKWLGANTRWILGVREKYKVRP